MSVRNVVPHQEFTHKRDGASEALLSSGRGQPPPTVAPLTLGAKRALQLAHTALILALVGLAAWYLWSSVLRSWSTGTETVRTVGERMVFAFAPENGVFHRETRLHHGTQVRRGDLLGTIESVSVTEEGARLEAEIQALTVALLRNDPRLVPPQFVEATPQVAHYHTDLAVRLQQALARLNQVEQKKTRLRVLAPVDGTIYFDVADCQAVEHDKTAIAQIWPDGTGVLVEIDAELTTVMRLLNLGTAHCTFMTPQGTEVVSIRPLRETLRPYFIEDTARQRRRQWTSIKCAPLALPDSLNRPGLVGALEY